MSLITIIDKINPHLKKANYVISMLMLFIVFFVLMVHLSQEIRDLDIWLHIKTGEQILLNKSIPLNDIYSFTPLENPKDNKEISLTGFTNEGKPWINHEWLFQLITYIVFDLSGFDGLIFMQNIVFIAIFLILLTIGFKRKNFLLASVVLYILLLNSSYRFTIRPDMFSVLFFVIFIFILKEKNSYINTLPLLQIIWTNFHGFFFIGPLIILIFAVTQKDRKLWIIFLLSLLSTIANPQLIKGAVYPLTTFFDLAKDKFVFGFVQELKPPFAAIKDFFDFRNWPFYKALLIVSIFSFRFNQKKFNLTLFILYITFLLISLSAIRNIIYFAIIAAIVIFYNTQERFSYDKSLFKERIITNRYYFAARYSLILVFAFCMIKNAGIYINSKNYNFDNFKFKSGLWGISFVNFPEKAVNFILKENLPKRLFNDFNSGSYLIGKAYPQRKVFIDGRTEFYGNKFLKEYKQVVEGNQEAIQSLIEKYKLEGFLLTMAMSNFDEKLAKYLYQNLDFKPIYFDESAIIFLKDTSGNQWLIKKFFIDLQNWQAPQTKLNKIGPKIIYPYPYIKRANALKEMGCFKAAISETEEGLKIMPDCAELLEILGTCYLELKEYVLALEKLRIALALLPDSVGLKNRFALALYKLGYYKEAELQLLPLIKIRPKDPDNYHALALVFNRQGRLNKALEMIKKANYHSQNKNSEYLELWADILAVLKKNQEALEKYELASKLNPKPEIKEKIEKLL